MWAEVLAMNLGKASRRLMQCCCCLGELFYACLPESEVTVDVHYVWCLIGIMFDASKIDADRRVMGIASAFEAASKMGRFFCLHRKIYL